MCIKKMIISSIMFCMVFVLSDKIVHADTADYFVPPETTSEVARNYFDIPQNANSYFDDTYLNTVVLTDNAPYKKGVAWTNGKVSLSDAFVYQAKMYLGRSKESEESIGGGDGVTFTLQNDARGLDAIGVYGGGLGAYAENAQGVLDGTEPIKNAISFEIDTYYNHASTDYDYTLPTPHTAFVIPADPVGSDKHIQAKHIGTTWDSTKWHDFKAEWAPDNSGNGVLTVTFDGDTSIYVINEYSDFFGGDLVHIGYTASTGGATSLQAVSIVEMPKLTYLLEFDLNGGDGEAPDQQELKEGDKAKSVEAPKRDGYVFLGWSQEKDDKDQLVDINTMVMPNHNVMLYAQWQKIAEPKQEDASTSYSEPESTTPEQSKTTPTKRIETPRTENSYEHYYDIPSTVNDTKVEASSYSTSEYVSIYSNHQADTLTASNYESVSEELPKEASINVVPKTGDQRRILLTAITIGVSVCCIVFIRLKQRHIK
jgi:uncharacterized repeat protein (TIGR02543 family)